LSNQTGKGYSNKVLLTSKFKNNSLVATSELECNIYEQGGFFIQKFILKMQFHITFTDKAKFVIFIINIINYIINLGEDIFYS